MDPQPSPKPPESPVKDDAYAQSLLHAVNAQYAVEQNNKPKVKHFISRKTIIVTVVSLVISLVAGVVFSHYPKSSSASTSPSQPQQLIKSAQTFDNQGSY